MGTKKSAYTGLKRLANIMNVIDFQVKRLTPVIEFIDCQIADVDELGLI